MDEVGLGPEDFTVLLDTLLEGFQVIDRDWRYLYLNETAATHSRRTRDELLGRTMMECYPGIESTPMFEHLRAAMEERVSRIVENEFRFPDGSTGHFELRIEPVPHGISILSIDVSPRRDAEAALARSEERLRHAQRMEAVGQLAAGVAHDFNSLITVLIGHGEHALASPSGPAVADVETMMTVARTCAELTSQLLAYGRRRVLRREPTALAEVVRGLEPVLRPALAPRIELTTELDAELPRLRADRSQLEQVLLNLVWNARDAIEGTGRIGIELATAELDASYVGVHPGSNLGPHAVLIVSDTGRGMDPATQQRVFEPFFTTKERGRGTGLGLATVYGIVRQHGGNVWVYSELGRGTTFKIYLPIVEEGAPDPVVRPAIERDEPSVVDDGEPKTILVVDDLAALRRLLTALLVEAGYRVVVACSAEEALERWNEERGAISLVITDVVMPGISGLELIDRLRATRPRLPVICTSGYTDSELRLRGAIARGVVFVEKPFSSVEMLERVRTLLRR